MNLKYLVFLPLLAIWITSFHYNTALADTLINRIEVKFSRKADTRIELRLQADQPNTQIHRIFPNQSNLQQPNEVLFEFEPIHAASVILDNLIWSFDENIPLEKFAVRPNFDVQEWDKPKKGMYSTVPFARVKIKIDLESGNSSELPQPINMGHSITDPYNQTYTGTPYTIDLDCTPKIKSRLEGKTLKVDFTEIRGMSSCLSTSMPPQQQAIFNYELLGKRQIIDNKQKKIFDDQRWSFDTAQQLNHSLEDNLLEDEHPVSKYIQSLVEKISHASDLKIIKPHVKIVNADVLNAFTIGGGYVYVYRKLIEKTRSESELAAVLAHEWGHVVASHVSQIGGINFWSYTLTLDGILLLSLLQKKYPILKVDTLVKTILFINGIALVQTLATTPFYRSNEEEADLLGVQYLCAAGFNSWGIASVFEMFEKIAPSKGSNEYLSTHPLNASRISSSMVYAGLFCEQNTTRQKESSKDYLEVKELLSKMPKAGEEDSDQIKKTVKKIIKGRIHEAIN